MDFYNGNMEDTLDNAVETLNNYSGLKAFIPIYEQALKDAYFLFRKQAFRKVSGNQWRRSPVNKLLMLSVTTLLAKYEKQYRAKIDTGIDLTNALAELIENDENLFNALTWGTNSKWNVDYAFGILKNDLFDKYLLSNG